VIVSPTGYVLFDDVTVVAAEVFLMTMEAHENRDAWPGAGDVPLIAEIVDPMYAVLIDLKRDVYARFGIPELWLIDADRRSVVVNSSPRGGAYSGVAEFGRGESWRSNALRGTHVRTDEIVGREREKSGR